MIKIKVYLDDNLDNDDLITALRKEGFKVISPRDIGMRHKKDEDHLKCAVFNDAILISYDLDFQKLAHKIIHKGIIIIRRNNNSKKDMSSKRIVKALKNIETLHLILENKLYYLNQFDY